MAVQREYDLIGGGFDIAVPVPRLALIFHGTQTPTALEGLHSARRGDFRIIYRISDVVTVVAIDHRATSTEAADSSERRQIR